MPEPNIDLVTALLSACMAVIIALLGWLTQKRQTDKTLELERQKLQEQQRQLEEKNRQEMERWQMQQEHETQRLQEEQRRFRETMDLELAKIRQTLPPETWVDDIINVIGQAPRSQPVRVISPYVVGPPIRERHNYYGRGELTADFYNRLLGGQIQSLSLLGVRRSGKTSFLYHISDLTTMQAYLGDRADSVIPVCVNLQTQIPDPRTFFSHLARLVIHAFEQRAKTEGTALPPVPNYDFLIEFFRQATDRGWYVVLLLDELEQLTKNKAFGEDFFGNLRAFTQGMTVALVTTSFRDLTRWVPDDPAWPVSPFVNVFQGKRLYLNAFHEGDAAQLIAAPAQRARHPFSDEEVAFMWRLSGGLPFALQMVADALYRAKVEGSLNAADAQQSARLEFTSSMEWHFGQYWKRFTESERRALVLLAQGKQPVQGGEAKTLPLLAQYGFVERVNAGYQIHGEALGEWIREIAA
jgi:hypothetical protein